MSAQAPSEEAGGKGDTPGAPSIEVALATYNSETYLPALLDSLFAQSRQDFTILVADDGSRDGTQDIVQAYSDRHPGRIRQLPGDRTRRGVIANFDRLLGQTSAPYVFLCDHDDVWLPDKIERTMQAMHALEARSAPGLPLLVHTNLIVTGPDLEALPPTYYSTIDRTRDDLLQLLLANAVTGCTAVINRPLCLKARPIPREAMMHDHWLALVAVTMGAMDYVDAPTILYRQHGRNAVGVKRMSLVRRIYNTLASRDRERILNGYSRQAAALLARFGDEMSPRQRAAAATLGGLWNVPRLGRFAALRRCGLELEGLIRNIALFIVVTRAGLITGPPKS